MTRNQWVDVGPSLIVGAGIIVSTLVAVLAMESKWLVLAAPLCLALTVVGADVLRSRLQGESAGPSPAALLMGGAFLLAGAMVALSEPSLVAAFIPILGSAASVTLLRPRLAAGRRACRWL